MDKIKQFTLAVAFLSVFSCSANASSVFTPLNFDDAQYTTSSSAPKIAADTTSIRSSAQTQAAKVDKVIYTAGSKNMQTAISELDNAQVQVRNELLNYKTKYSEVDAKYTAIKTERSNLSKQIKECERKIRRLDNAKEKIRKNMVTE